MWFDKTARTFRCEVWYYRAYRETVSGALMEIMEEVSDRYGYA